jgi:DnaK suppressor protein
VAAARCSEREAIVAKTMLTKAQLETLRHKLQAERRRILAVVQQPLSEAPSDEPRELEEVAQRAAERDEELGVGAAERAVLADVDRALAKLDAGTYGLSEKTGAAIPFERLEAVPWARQGVDEEAQPGGRAGSGSEEV